MKIKLKATFGGGEHIESPSGKHITSRSLEVGKTYLHRNLIFIRSIIRIENNEVTYSQFGSLGICPENHFVAVCPNEATPDEMIFLYSSENCFARSLESAK